MGLSLCSYYRNLEECHDRYPFQQYTFFAPDALEHINISTFPDNELAYGYDTDDLFGAGLMRQNDDHPWQTSADDEYYADNFAGRTYFNLTGGEHMDCEFFEENSLLYFQHNSRHPIARNIYASGRMGAGSEGRRPYQHTLPYGLQVLFAISSILVIAAVVYFVYGMMYPTAYAAGAATKGDFAAVEMIKVDA
jgi:hypothetical protein